MGLPGACLMFVGKHPMISGLTDPHCTLKDEVAISYVFFPLYICIYKQYNNTTNNK